MNLSSLLYFTLFIVFTSYSSIAFSKIITDQWMELYEKSESVKNVIGYSRTKVEINKSTTTVYEENKINFKGSNYVDEVVSKSNYFIKDRIVDSFNYMMSSTSQRYKITGYSKDGKLIINTYGGKGTEQIEFDIDHEFIVSGFIPTWLSKGNLKKGAKYKLYLFDPIMIVSGYKKQDLQFSMDVIEKERVKVGKDSYMAYKVEINFLDLKTTIWVTDKGHKVKELILPGMVGIKSDREAISNLIINNYDLAGKTSIKSNVKISKPQETKYIKFNLMYANEDRFYLDDLYLVDNYRQFYKNGFYEVIVNGGENSVIDRNSKNDYENYLLPNVFVQSGDKSIIEIMKSITSKSSSKLEGVKKLNNWVYKKLEKVTTFGVPNALEVLDNKRGDCNEHAVLFAALSRSFEVPTKIVLGIVYIDEKFYYHAWNEVFIDKWIAVDPSFGQFPADATHIKLMEGNIGKGVKLLKLVGKLNIEILEVY